MVTGELNQSPSEIKTDIITNNLNQISNDFNEKITLLNENNNKFKSEMENIIKPQVQNINFKNNRKFLQNIKQCEICFKNNYTTEFRFFKNKHISNNNDKMQFTICLRSNHYTENCRFKNNSIKCQLCGMIGYSAQTCKKLSGHTGTTKTIHKI